MKDPFLRKCELIKPLYLNECRVITNREIKGKRNKLNDTKEINYQTHAQYSRQITMFLYKSRREKKLKEIAIE